MEQELAKRLAAKAARGELDEDGQDPGSNLEPPSPLAVAASLTSEASPDAALEGVAPERSGEVARAANDRESGDVVKDGRTDDDIEPAPDSGIRSSQNQEELAAALPRPEPAPARPLTYSMYTISDLDAGEAKAVRLAPAPSIHSEEEPRWQDLSTATAAALRSWLEFVRLPSPRPRFRDFARASNERFVGELRRVLVAIHWRRWALGAAIGIGSMLLVLVGVMTLADMTDDLKPRHAARSASGTMSSTAGGSDSPPGTTELASASQPDAPAPRGSAATGAGIAARPVTVATTPTTVKAVATAANRAAAAPPATGDIVELDDLSPARVSKTPSSPAANGGRSTAKQKAKKVQAVERFIP